MSAPAAAAWVLRHPAVADPDLPTVVMLHGVGGDHSIWQPQSAFLSRRGFNVLVPDLPGHGRTPGPAAETIADLVDWTLSLLADCGVVKAHVVGHSLGSLIAVGTAAANPALVERIVLLGSSDRLRVHPELLERAHNGDRTVVDLMSAWSFPVANAGGSGAPGMSSAAATRRLLEGTALATIAAGLAACDSYDAAVPAATISSPVLIVCGEGDRMAPCRGGAALANAFPNAALRVLPGTGHCMTLERPGEVARILLSWFASGEG